MIPEQIRFLLPKIEIEDSSESDISSESLDDEDSEYEPFSMNDNDQNQTASKAGEALSGASETLQPTRGNPAGGRVSRRLDYPTPTTY
jgi:hypothetical protein